MVSGHLSYQKNLIYGPGSKDLCDSLYEKNKTFSIRSLYKKNDYLRDLVLSRIENPINGTGRKVRLDQKIGLYWEDSCSSSSSRQTNMRFKNIMCESRSNGV